MDEMELLRKLGAAAGADAPTRVNVVAQVMATIHQRSESRDPLLWVAAALSSALALGVGVVALQMYLSYSEPLGQWVSSVDTVLR